MNNQNDLDRILRSDQSVELTSQDIVKIIKAARESDVSLFEFNGIRIKFRKKVEVLEHIAPPQPMVGNLDEKPISEDADNSLEESQEQEALIDTVRSKEDELANLAIIDPERYEELISSGDLVDAKDQNYSGT